MMGDNTQNHKVLYQFLKRKSLSQLIKMKSERVYLNRKRDLMAIIVIYKKSNKLQEYRQIENKIKKKKL